MTALLAAALPILLPAGQGPVYTLPLASAASQAPAELVRKFRPVAYWPLDEVADGSTPDRSGNGHAALLRGLSGKPDLADGVVGKAMRFFRSASTWLEVPYSDALQLTDGFTAMAWVKVLKRRGGFEVIGFKSDRSGNPPWPGWRLRVAWAMAVVEIGTADGRQYRATSPQWSVHPGKWCHIAATYDGRALRLYVNAAPAAECVAPGPIARQARRPLIIGNYFGRKDAYAFDGFIDEVWLLPRPLTLQEIEQIAGWGL